MLSRASSDAGTRLRRSKSTSTVCRQPPPVPEALDPNVAQQHALAAATTAFVRHHAIEAVPERTRRSSDIARSKSHASRKSQGSHFPPRESNSHSKQPHKREQTTNAGIIRQTRASHTATEAFPPFQATLSVERSSLAQPSVSFNENVRPSSQPTKPHRPSAASSITSQQIRKARSMYYASSVQTGSPLPRPPAKYLTTPPSISPAPDSVVLPLPNRTLAVSPLASPRLPLIVAVDETVDVDKARDKYLQDFQQRQVQHKPSLFLAPFKKRQDKVRNKASRIFSSSLNHDNTQLTPTEPTPDVTATDVKPHKEKRSFSGSIKNKFKSIFRRTSKNTAAIPIQQVEASRDYFGDYMAQVDPPSQLHGGFDIPSPSEEMLARTRSRTPSTEAAKLSLARPSSRESLRSLHSEDGMSNNNSRVTSWSNSSIGCGTLTQRDIKRLTVIHEAKDSIGSEVDRLHQPPSPTRNPPPIPGLSAFHEPMPRDMVAEAASRPVDPKRVFSALMKEIDASNASQSQTGTLDLTPNLDSDVFVSGAGRYMNASSNKDANRPPSQAQPDSVAAQSKASSIRSFSRAFRSTIRTVTPDQASSPAPERTTSIRGVVRIPRVEPESDSAGPSPEQANLSGLHVRATGTERRPRNRLHKDAPFPQVASPSREQIEQRVERSKRRWKTPLEDNAVPALPRSANRTFTVANIARRTFSHRPLKEHVTAKTVIKAEREASPTLPAPTVHNRSPPQSPKPRQLISPLSPSVYSRNTDGFSLLPNDSVVSFHSQDAVEEVGSAVIITSHPVRSYVIGTPSPQHTNTHSTQFSRDWKAWLAREVSEFENLPQEDIAITPIASRREDRNHHRESTQTSEDDTTIIMHQSIEQQTPGREIFRTPVVTRTLEERLPAPQRAKELAPPILVATPVATVHKSTFDMLQTPNTEVEEQIASGSVQRPTPWPKTGRYSSGFSTPSEQSYRSSSGGRRKSDTSARMNDRFPYIDNRRRSRNNSSPFAHHTKRSPDGDSLVSTKMTPSPNIYSDISAPLTGQTSKQEPRLKACDKEGRHEGDKENKKGKSTLLFPSLPHSPPSSTARPMPLRPLSSSDARGRSHSSLAQYETSSQEAENDKTKRTSSPVPTPARMRSQTTPVSRMGSRSRSAFDLRTPFAPSPLRTPITGCPQKRHHHTPSSISCKIDTGPALEGETLRMLLEDPCSTLRITTTSPPRMSPELQNAIHSLRIRHSTSTLILNKEPSPVEERAIDALLETHETTEGLKSCGGSRSRAGSITPGQRLAERFLRERHAGSGAGSPVETLVSTESRERKELSPAFL